MTSFLSLVRNDSSQRCEGLAEEFRRQGIETHDPLGAWIAGGIFDLSVSAIKNKELPLKNLFSFSTSFFDDGEKEKKFSAKEEKKLLADFNKLRATFNGFMTRENALALADAYKAISASGNCKASVERAWDLLGPKVERALST